MANQSPVATRAAVVAEALRQEILDRGVGAGEVFLTEAKVGERYGVSRPVAREAVSELRALGILRSRQAKGMIVSRSDPVGLLARTLPFFGRSDRDFRHLAELRMALELGVVELAARNRTADQLAKLDRLADDYAAALLQTDARRARELDLRFHQCLLSMSDNPLVVGVHRVIGEYFRAVGRRRHRSAETDRAVHEHRMIADAIRQRNTEAARAVLRVHLERTLEGAASASPCRKYPVQGRYGSHGRA